MTQSFVSVGIFLAVLACLPWAIKWVRARSGVGSREVGGQAKIVSAVAVGPHQKVVTVEVGPEGARIWLTLGVTSQAISCLHSLPIGPSQGVRNESLSGPLMSPNEIG